MREGEKLHSERKRERERGRKAGGGVRERG